MVCIYRAIRDAPITGWRSRMRGGPGHRHAELGYWPEGAVGPDTRQPHACPREHRLLHICKLLGLAPWAGRARRLGETGCDTDPRRSRRPDGGLNQPAETQHSTRFDCLFHASQRPPTATLRSPCAIIELDSLVSVPGLGSTRSVHAPAMPSLCSVCPMLPQHRRSRCADEDVERN